MPVNIYKVTPDDQDNEEIAWLCDDEWQISPQIAALSTWLELNSSMLQPGEYVADVGFGWRRDASAGGPVLEPVAMRRMAELGMSLYLSEYGFFTDNLAKVREGDQSE
jgi:hypothetical protein